MASSCGKHQSQYSHGHSRNGHAKTTHRVLEYVDTYGSGRQYWRMWVGQMSEISQSDYGWIEHKKEHNLHLACEDSPQRAFFFCTFSCSLLALLASTVHWLRFFLFLNVPTVGYIQYSTPQNVYTAEDKPCCPTRPLLSRSTILPCPPSLG